MKNTLFTILTSWLLAVPVFGEVPVKIADLNSGTVGSFPAGFKPFSGQVYFSAYTLSTGRELWKSNGTNIVLAANVNPTADDLGGGVIEGNNSDPAWLTEWNGKLYFSSFEPRRGGELWVWNGTNATRVSDINPDANDTIKLQPNSAYPSEITVFNGALYFSANSGGAPLNYELWKYDGISTTRAANIHPDSGPDFSSYPSGLTVFNNQLFFMADDGEHGYELWRHNGTNAVLIDLNPGGPESSSYPKYFTALNNELYFQAYTAANGFELWKTDGTTASLAVDFYPGPESSYVEYLRTLNGSLYFRATNSTYGSELWKFDGTNATLVKDINPFGNSYPKNPTVFSGALFFAADDGVNGFELWKYDGTNTSMVTNLNSSADSFPEQLTVVGHKLYFAATTPETGYELWQYDGGTVSLVTDINAGPAHSYPLNLTEAQGDLYFSANDSDADWEPWVIKAVSGSNQAPTVTLTAPANGATFLTTDSITFSASASDDGSVTKVEFFAGGNLIGADTSSPFSVAGSLSAGSHSITAKATDNTGATTTSVAVNITVNAPGNQLPTITLNSDPSGKLLAAPATVSLKSSASDADGTISQVEFFSGSNSIGVAATAPYEITLTNLAAGLYSFTAIATDNSGSKATSAIISVSIAAQPRITSIKRINGSSVLNVNGTTGIPHILEATLDFTSWSTIATNTPAAGATTFNEQADQSKRFYRIVVR